MGSAKFVQKNSSQNFQKYKPVCCTFMVLLYNSIQCTMLEAKYLALNKD